MENEKVENKNEETINAKVVLFIAVGAYVLGCIAGAASNSKKITEAYNKGVLDTVTKLVFNNK